MKSGQLAVALQLREGKGLILSDAIGIEQLVVHTTGAVRDQLQREGFDAGGMQAVKRVNNMSQLNQSLPRNDLG